MTLCGISYTNKRVGFFHNLLTIIVPTLWCALFVLTLGNFRFLNFTSEIGRMYFLLMVYSFFYIWYRPQKTKAVWTFKYFWNFRYFESFGAPYRKWSGKVVLYGYTDVYYWIFPQPGNTLEIEYFILMMSS